MTGCCNFRSRYDRTFSLSDLKSLSVLFVCLKSKNVLKMKFLPEFHKVELFKTERIVPQIHTFKDDCACFLSL